MTGDEHGHCRGCGWYGPIRDDGNMVWHECDWALTEAARIIASNDAQVEVVATSTSGGAAVEVERLRDAITLIRALHKRRVGDYRTGHGEHCSVCSVQRSQPGYNERESWREPAPWPCDTIRALDA